MQQHPIELLSPARDLECGVAAINHGADAVYIGPPKFGARAAAGNSLQDIEKLVRHAHTFSASVYIALNTLFDDKEIEEAVRLAHQLYDIGADALIIQDMGLLECDLPPIQLHASTQTNNRTPEKVQFLERVGFEQVVLARELSLEQIREIRSATSVPLECFIHGALCVSYSGQCYISEVVSGRSANRGECAQFCRHQYTLKDAAGKIVEKSRYLLSLKDLDLSAHVKSMIEAGVSSFKIEGRLKDSNYVKNVTAYYRQLLDEIIADNPQLQHGSSGKCEFSFKPDTNKSFNRGKTDYFLNAPRNTPGSLDTPKSLGEEIGIVKNADRHSFSLNTTATLHNGDGLCYFDAGGTLVGVKANRVEGSQVFHRDHSSPQKGTHIYRNLDVDFLKKLKNSEQCRFLTVDVEITETLDSLQCDVRDGDDVHSTVELKAEKEFAKQPGKTAAMVERQIRKSGGTVFRVDSVSIAIDENVFIPTATINELRRLAFDNHLVARQESYSRPESQLQKNEILWLSNKATYLDNITNRYARDFYQRHGVTEFDIAPQGVKGEQDVALMTTKYCIKAQLGICPKISPKVKKLAEPLTLTDKTGVYELEFNCAQCEMVLRKKK
ncbi:peptidase U32 family protein [Desulfosediminicola flagellatus]|uniref:peptidase U32 family protein n=1 Tax=Desulfosediminicola flagellatus TaxID=2569541 RepID=UPI0010AD9B95|nr:U32 family peptidase [Desulfosediminicola flagellatus]